MGLADESEERHCVKLIPNLAPIDKKAIEELGIPGLTLMEAAGCEVTKAVQRIIDAQRLVSPLIVVVCGKGNNGGDGYVCARLLAAQRQCEVVVILTATPKDMTEDSLTNFNRLQEHALTLVPANALEQVEGFLHRAAIVVDALFGSGLSRPVEGESRELIKAINRSEATVVSVDLPSGIQGATGAVLGVAVKADETVTFAVPKPGLYLCPGKAYAGHIDVVDIGIPQALIDADPSRVFLLTPEDIITELPKREACTHKYSYGAVLVIAGSRDMPGAAQMCAEAALRTGAGIVKLAAPESALVHMELPPEIVRYSLPETEAGILGPKSLQALENAWDKISVVALGPGITQQPDTVRFMEGLLPILLNKFGGPVVLDADGLNCLSQLSVPYTLSERFILTPHLGECVRLTGLDKTEVEENLLEAARKTSERYSATVVLKSASTVIYNTQGNCWINATGNPGMATAGSGDILTGMIAGLLAQGLSPISAARVGVYLHGAAGDKAAEALTEYCMTATDLTRYLPKAIRQLEVSGRPY
jgi:ADP-dependent NAD(P)H-hydrate dehydratase / NAD(P)H-hydrate epimerase